MCDDRVTVFLMNPAVQREYEAEFSAKHTFAQNIEVLNTLLKQAGQPCFSSGGWIYEKDTMRHYDEHRILESMNICDGMHFIVF